MAVTVFNACSTEGIATIPPKTHMPILLTTIVCFGGVLFSVRLGIAILAVPLILLCRAFVMTASVSAMQWGGAGQLEDTFLRIGVSGVFQLIALLYLGSVMIYTEYLRKKRVVIRADYVREMKSSLLLIVLFVIISITAYALL